MKEKRARIVKIFILILCVLTLGFAFMKYQGTRARVDYAKQKEEVVATVDGKSLVFEDLAFYILYEERVVEEQARIYNPSSTKDYWNIHTNDTFIQSEAKDAVINMAIHDELYYQLAVKEGIDELTTLDKRDLENAKTDFWEDLLDEQWEKLPASEDVINAQIEKIAIAEKYEIYIANENNDTLASYKYDGYGYSQLLKEHEVSIEKIWDRFVMGDITLTHKKFNAINGFEHEKKKEK